MAPADFSGVDGTVDSTDRVTGSTARIIPRTPAVPVARQRSAGERFQREVLGLGTRNVVEGAADLVGIVGDPVIDLINWAGEKPQTTASLITGERPRRWERQKHVREAWSDQLTDLGVPLPETSGERISGDVGRALTGTALTMGTGTLLAPSRAAGGAMGSPSMSSRLGAFLTANPKLQAISTATGAYGASQARESGYGEGAQLAAGLASGLAPGVLTSAPAYLTRLALRGGEAGRQNILNNLEAFKAAGTTPTVS